jgi:branched-chain amino acid transport system ATP-binding protein
VCAVDAVDLVAHRDEIIGIIGPNGAGKTTLFEVLSGFITPSAGQVLLDGDDITGAPVHVRSRRGLLRGFQDARLFPAMTVVEVLQVAHERVAVTTSDLVGELLNLPSARRTEAASREHAEEAIERFGLSRYRHVSVGDLSTGTRRVVEIAAVLASAPRVLLLDEPTAGITTSESEALTELLRGLLAGSGTTLVLIEHDLPMVSALSDRIYVMVTGRVLTSGPPDVVMSDPRVVAAYLGDDANVGPEVTV